MGKREQFLRVLLRAAENMGISGLPGGSLEDQALPAWEAVAHLYNLRETPDRDAWLMLYDTMQTIAPAGGVHDEPMASGAS